MDRNVFPAGMSCLAKQGSLLLPSYYAGMAKLNHLSGEEWLTFTKTWFVHNPVIRTEKMVHPATFPESLAEGFISFFTKPGDWILDPFLGSGSSLLAAKKLGRNGVGIELYNHFVRLARQRISSVEGSGIHHVITGDCRTELPKLKSQESPPFSFCISSPPYWCQLKSFSERKSREDKSQDRKSKGLRTRYGRNPNDLGNIKSYQEFLDEQYNVFSLVYKLMRKGGYLVLVTNNVYMKGRLYPLAFDTLRTLSKLWVPKDEKIWCQDNKKLTPFGMWTAWIGNRSHHYCLIFRKEKEEKEQGQQKQGYSPEHVLSE
jgi:DNA modification methylase